MLAGEPGLLLGNQNELGAWDMVLYMHVCKVWWRGSCCWR